VGLASSRPQGQLQTLKVEPAKCCEIGRLQNWFSNAGRVHVVVDCSRALWSVTYESKQSRFQARSFPSARSLEQGIGKRVAMILACAYCETPRGARRSHPLLYATTLWPLLTRAIWLLRPTPTSWVDHLLSPTAWQFGDCVATCKSCRWILTSWKLDKG
jgi:hypothetical protein